MARRRAQSEERCGSPGFGSGGFFDRGGKFLHKLFAETVEAAVGHEEKQVAGTRFNGEFVGDGFGPGNDLGGFAEGADACRYGFRIHTIFVAVWMREEDAAQE